MKHSILLANDKSEKEPVCLLFNKENVQKKKQVIYIILNQISSSI